MTSNLRSRASASRSNLVALGTAWALAALVSACSGDSTGVSSGPFDVSITAGQVRSEYSFASERWECTYTLTARGSGEAGAFGFWESGERVFQFTGGTEEEIPLDQGAMLEYWTLDRLYSGGVQKALRIAWAAEPFDLEYTFRLEPGDGASAISRSVVVACGE